MNNHLKGIVLALIAVAVCGVRADSAAIEKERKAIEETSQEMNKMERRLSDLSGGLNALADEFRKFDARQRELSKRCPFGKVTDNCVGDWIQYGLDAVAMGAKRLEQASKSQLAADLNQQYKKLKEKKAQQQAQLEKDIKAAGTK